MAFEDFVQSGEGTYGEGRAFSAATYLRKLRDALEQGQISVGEYLQKGQPVAEQAYRDVSSISAGGQKAANAVNPALSILEQAGFKNKPTGDKQFNVLPDLPSKYQQQIRESLLPADLSPDQKAAFLQDIPSDIPFGSDQYNIEKEGLRQRLQSEKTAGTQAGQRKIQLGELATLLSQQADTNFQRSVPKIAEQANTAGIFRSTGYGQALAEQQRQLQEDVTQRVSQQGLMDRATETQSLGDILAAQQGFQSSGLQRQFSLDDFASQARFARELADASKPQVPGKTRGEKYAQGVSSGSQLIAASKSGQKKPAP